MAVFFLDDSKDCNVRYIVITDITLFSYLVRRPPMIASADKNISVKSAQTCLRAEMTWGKNDYNLGEDFEM